MTPTAIAVVTLACAVYLFFMVFATKTNGFRSAMILHFLPFLIGVWLLLLGLDLLGVVRCSLRQDPPPQTIEETADDGQ